jgi:hypothetical protein
MFMAMLRYYCFCLPPRTETGRDRQATQRLRRSSSPVRTSCRLTGHRLSPTYGTHVALGLAGRLPTRTSSSSKLPRTCSSTRESAIFPSTKLNILHTHALFHTPSHAPAHAHTRPRTRQGQHVFAVIFRRKPFARGPALGLFSKSRRRLGFSASYASCRSGSIYIWASSAS